MRVFAAFIAIWICAPVFGADTRELFERARALQERNQNLVEAIRLYGEVVAQEKTQRALAARAQYEQGVLYTRLGRRSEARRAFQVLIRDFPDQPALTALARTRLPAGEIPSGAANRALWTGPQVDASGSPSPDGRSLSYTDWSTGDLRIRDLGSGESRAVTRHGASPRIPFSALWSIFSPDGKQLAYLWTDGADHSELRTIEVTGIGERTAYTAPSRRTSVRPSDWSPDGRFVLAFVREGRGATRLFVIGVRDGSARAVDTSGELVEGCALFSRDGRYIVYEVQAGGADGSRDIWSMAVDGSQPTPLVRHPADDRIAGWSPDGRRLLFSSNRSGAQDLWAVLVADGKTQSEPEIVYHHLAGGDRMGFTRRGALFYLVSTSESEVFTAEMDFAAAKLMTPPQPVSQRFVSAKTSPLWAAGGGSILYLPMREGAPSLILFGADGERELHPQLRETSRAIATHPDGRSVFVHGVDMDGRRGVFRVELGSGAAQFIANITDRPAWSPDGATLYHGGGDVLTARDVATGAVREVFRHAVHDAFKNPNTAVSPDGATLAVVIQDAPGSQTLAVTPSAGGAPKPLFTLHSPEHFGGNSLVWMSDGRYIIASRNGPERSALWRFSVDGAAAVPLPLEMKGEIKAVRLHPDAHRLVLLNTWDAQEIWILENFLTGSRTNR